MRRCLYACLLATGVVLALVSPIEAETTYLVQPGDTLSGIADRFGLTVEELARANAISNWDLIFWGTELRIPERTRSLGYVVKPGDTLGAIAGVFGVNVADLVRENPDISDPNLIYPGQLIRVPARGGGGDVAVAPRGSVRGLIADHAARYGLDRHLVEALAWQESGWQQNVVSAAGASGVMQIMPYTAQWLSSDVLGVPLDVVGSVSDNVMAGTAYLKWLLERTSSVEMAIAAYYQGLASVQERGLLPDTRQFVANVMAIYQYILRFGEPPVQ